jgi:stearoyl-CoA desaturase (delta-9 desaturase)
MHKDGKREADAHRNLELNPLTLTKQTVEALVFHYKEGNINWPMAVYITLVHVAAVIGLSKLPGACWQTQLFALILWPITGLGITGGVHRLWAHRSYEAHWTVRTFLMLINSMANQGSIYHWSRDHRVHHKHSETDADPHNAQRGFFFAHMGWLYVKKHPDVIAAGRTLDFSDLERDPVVMFQDKLDPWFALFMCYVFPGLVAKYAWGGDFWVAFWVAGALRYCWVLHCTWLVNSAAHMFGDHPYDEQSWPAENPFVSIMSVGEGWHNWHHKYPFDYAASEYGVDAQYNPTKLFIDTCAKAGLVTKRKRALGAWEKTKERRDAAELSHHCHPTEMSEKTHMQYVADGEESKKVE